MADNIRLDNLLISTAYGGDNVYESTGAFWESDPYIRWLKIEFAIEDDNSFINVDVYGEKVKVLPLGRLFGALILGRQAYHDEQDLFLACDDCNVDLAATVCELDKEGLLESIDGGYPDILYIHNMELSSDIIDAPNVAKFFECLPRIVFQYTNIYPEVIAYAIASADGFYDSQAQTTDFDKRSVDGYSPLLYTENGFRLSESGNLLFCQTE